MQKQIKKNIKQRLQFLENEKKRIILKAITQNLLINKQNRWKTQQQFFEITQESSLTRIKNRCIMTGRSRSIYRFFKLSRLQLRKWASYGFLPGVSKHSW